MKDKNNKGQVYRVDSRGAFVEVLNWGFPIGKVQLGFAKYDVKRPANSRITNYITVYLDFAEFLTLEKRILFGLMHREKNEKKKAGDNNSIYSVLGGVTAEKLQARGKARPDGRCLSRSFSISASKSEKLDYLLSASVGPGEKKGNLIAPCGKAEESVAVAMKEADLEKLFFVTKMHMGAYWSAEYMMNPVEQLRDKNSQNNSYDESEYPEYDDVA